MVIIWEVGSMCSHSPHIGGLLLFCIKHVTDLLYILLQLKVSGKQRWTLQTWNCSTVDLAVVRLTCCWQTGVIPTPQSRCWYHIYWELVWFMPPRDWEDLVCGLQIRLLIYQFLANRTNGCASATVLCPSIVVCLSVVTLCIVAKRCVLVQKLILRAYRMSYMRNRLVPKWMTLTFV